MSEVSTGAPAKIEVHSGGDSVWLRPLSPENAQAYFDLIEYDRAHLSQHGDLTAENCRTVADAQKWMEESPANEFRFGVWDGDTMVGTNTITAWGEGKFESSSWIGAEYTGKHYAARARKLLLGVAFHELGAEEVFSRVKVGNEPSRKSVEKSGYQFKRIDEDGYRVYIFKKEWL